MSEIHGFPIDQAAQLWEKINYLVEDPYPDGKLKKKLNAKDKLYRLRVGNFRVFYTFGDTWVRLLGIRARKDKTIYNLGNMNADEPQKLPDGKDPELDIQSNPGVKNFSFQAVQDDKVSWLPQKITKQWLEALKIPEGFHPAFMACETEEALLSIDAPEYILERIVDNLFPKPLDEVAAQPDLVVQSTKDLIRYKEGDLVSFLLKLDKDQIRLTHWALKGPTMVKGGAGTGKSTIALYRIKAFLERPEASGQENVLFTTYTRALMNASRQLLEQLLTADQLKRVHIATCDAIAIDIVKKKREISSIISGYHLETILSSVRKEYSPDSLSGFEKKLRLKTLAQYTDSYLLEEFDWIIDGRMLNSVDAYLSTPRPGRGYIFRKGIRHSIWELHKKFVAKLQEFKLDRFADIRCEAFRYIQDGNVHKKYDYVVVDEAQDLSPASLSLMAELVKNEAGLFLAADNKQSLYSKSYGWSMIHPRLQFKGRTAVLKRNYRSTIEIDKAAFDILVPEENEILESSSGIHSGPMPVLLRNVLPEDESIWIGRYLKQISKHLHLKKSSAAILVPLQTMGVALADGLNHLDIPAKFFDGKDLDLKSDKTKILTLHAAKGLEFPIVIIAGLPPGKLLYQRDVSDEIFQERLKQERRLLYVGMTRAMRGLMVIQNLECEHEALVNMDTKNWYVEEV